MGSRLSDFEDLRDRIAKLEKQNRRFKQFGTAGLLGVVLLLVTGQAPVKKVVEADEFILRDHSKNVRAKLSMMAEPLDSPEMVLFDDKGRPSVQLTGGFTPTSEKGVHGGGVSLFDSHGNERGSFLVDDDSSYVRLADAKDSVKTLLREGFVLTAGGGLMVTNSETNAIAVVSSDHVMVSDRQGFFSTLGTADLVTPKTGETHKTSAASLVLFDKEKNVIWKTP
jgi:hypothetical protein